MVPTSAVTGSNVGREREKGLDWYQGDALLQTLEQCALPHRDAQGPLRITIACKTKRGNAVFVDGQVEQGTVNVGDVLALLTPAQGPAAGLVEPVLSADCAVQAIESGGREVRLATARELVRLKLTGHAHQSVGHILFCPESALKAVVRFKAHLRFLEFTDDSIVVTVGFRCVLHIHQSARECEIGKLIEAVDPSTLQKEVAPKFVRAPMEVQAILLLTDGPMVPIGIGNSSRLACFCLRTDVGTIALGTVADLPKSR